MNLPTKITVIRIAMVPIIILFACLESVFQQFYIPMAILYMITSATDALDGHIARKRNLVTDLGKFLDPIADKILVLTGLIILLQMTFVPKGGGTFPVLPPYFGFIGVIIILTREFIIGVLRQMAASKGSVLAADKLGKAKTVATMIAIPMLMLVPLINENWGDAFKWIGVVFLFAGWAMYIIAVLLTVLSGANYIIKNKHVFIDRKPTDNNCAACDNGEAVSEDSAEIKLGDGIDRAEIAAVVRYAIEIGHLSIGAVQRRFEYSFPKAARIVLYMEESGYISRSEDSKAYDVDIDMVDYNRLYGDIEE